MSQESFESNFQELLISINAAWDNQRIMPGLILLYSAIDIMAWLNRPETELDVREVDFINWVDHYLIPHYARSINGADLYAARCSVLHSYTARSRRSRQGRARQLFYAWGDGRVDVLQQTIDALWQELINEAQEIIAHHRTGILADLKTTADASVLSQINQLIDYFGLNPVTDLQVLVDTGTNYTPIAVHIDELFNAFVKGISQFNEELPGDSQRAAMVYSRASKFYGHIPSSI